MTGKVPGIAGVEHIGFTVPDLDAAVAFFVDVLGCQKIYEVGPFQSDGDWMQTHLGVDRRAVMKRLAFLRCGHGSNFEIFEYDAPDQARTPPANSDVGGHHLAFYALDFDTAYAALQDSGVSILGVPTYRADGPSGGQTWVYFLTPWGMQCELVSFPGRKAYERATLHRLWHPVHPQE
ncbi:VOC family protein [Pseudohoeflea coraliihabitans]|uniref:VOC family protein n=1 Tax=Pseudohoeflea coraliihabitans TaxID=2860393 RepID=A0ABS6WIB6_9HYPH|nr:VOC family protein [Pseudohoeflea sp. DP4N28-3]MBW3095687.1 VOC family protein [Pseudohoeflea sp. DP4N28-3]